MFNIQIRRRSEVGPQARAGVRARALTSLVAMSLLFASMAAHAEAGDDATRVDLNRASAEELATLPGIGAAKAAAIVEFRTSSGAFASLDELEAVRGIGPALVAKLRPHVTLGSQGGAKSPSKAGTKGRTAATK
jgi:competence protein ComEA